MTKTKKTSDSLSVYGAHRVLKPDFALPQGALKLDNRPVLLSPHELLLDVDFLMLDATSMKQIRKTCGGNDKRAAQRIQAIVSRRGKMHNPDTNSGGVLVGRIKQIGDRFFDIHGQVTGANKPGQTIIPIASLSTLPLNIKKVKSISGDRVVVEATAVMFSCMRLCPVPKGFSPELALACVDISSLVPQVKRTLTDIARRRKEEVSVLVLGCGKAGLAAMCCVRELAKTLRAKKSSCSRFKILAMDADSRRVAFVKKQKLADAAIAADACNAGELYSFVRRNTKGALCDFVVNVVNVPGTETATVLCARESPRATVLWFSMATRFDRAALATDALGKDVTMIVGNGVAREQAGETFALVRVYPPLRRCLEE